MKSVLQNSVKLALAAYSTGDAHCKSDNYNDRYNEAYPSTLSVRYSVEDAFVQSDFPISRLLVANYARQFRLTPSQCRLESFRSSREYDQLRRSALLQESPSTNEDVRYRNRMKRVKHTSLKSCESSTSCFSIRITSSCLSFTALYAD